MEVTDFQKIDDVDLNGKMLKKIITKGVSTSKPDASSLLYFALTFLGPNKEIWKEDLCFHSDWWEDYEKLNILGCRKVYLDEYKISRMLKRVFYRMKPAEIAEVECRDPELFSFGQDFE